jgi:acetyl esterase
MSIRDKLESTIARALFSMPTSLTGKLIGRPKTNRAGATLDPTVQLGIEVLRLSGRPELNTLEPPIARAQFRAMIPAMDLARADLPRIEQLSIPGPAGPIPARLYLATKEPGPHSTLVFFHGGGFTIGDLDTHDPPCRELARASGAAVIAVDYRLAPEHRFPAAVDDALAAYRWIRDHGSSIGVDPRRIAVAGDSAGGTLSATISRTCAVSKEAGPIAQILIYPLTDLTQLEGSREEFQEGFLLTRSLISYFQKHYFDRDQSRDPRASPLLAEDVTGIPPTLILTAGFDPLRDEGEAYAKKLTASGARVEHVLYPSLTHGFFSMAGVVPAAKRSVEKCAAFLKTEYARRIA